MTIASELTAKFAANQTGGPGDEYSQGPTGQTAHALSQVGFERDGDSGQRL